MKWNEHYRLQGKHAFLGASQWRWINYDNDKLLTTYQNSEARERGTELHELAANLIKLKVRLPKTKTTLNMYVNDAIGYGMDPEVVLYYSDNAFGTADTIKFDGKKKVLRIHDLKTGITEAHMEQLMVYTVFFCLEYHIDIRDIDVILRLYQSNEITEVTTIPDMESYDETLKDRIYAIQGRLIESDQILEKYKSGEQ